MNAVVRLLVFALSYVLAALFFAWVINGELPGDYVDALEISFDGLLVLYFTRYFIVPFWDYLDRGGND